MAYQEYTISALADIPSIVSTFAAAMGWNVVADVLRHPNYEGAGPGGPGFKLSTSLVGLLDDLTWNCTTGETATTATLRSPILSTVENPTVGNRVLPTKLFLIGMLLPQPYLAIVVEYGYNMYRHLYLGFLEKQGTFTGGVCIAASAGRWTVTSETPRWSRSDFRQGLFNANQSLWAANRAGGVLAISADNPSSWRNFRASGSPTSSSDSLYQSMSNTMALGGFGDGLNDPYVAKGKAQMAGANVLVPINLCLPRMLSTDFRLKPIGIPSGVRMINIQEIEAQATLSLGSDTWHSFAEAKKSSSATIPKPNMSGSQYRLDENSYYLGYAYRG